MTARAAAVVTAVGPFTLYGEPLVAACVATQTHYADTTGEVTWVLDMLEQYGEAAACKGVKLVSCCGMDCIPADLGTLVAMEGLPVPAVKVDINMQTINMLPSGGTMASAAQVGKEMVARGVTSVPYLLTPDAPESLRVDQAVSAKAQQGFGWSEEFNRYTLPWPMALVDNRIVRRSLVLREQPTQVDESLAVEALGRLGLFALRHLPSVMPYLSAKSRPKAGEGPSKAIQQDGGLQMEVEASGSRGERCRVRVCIDGDPGYLCTAAMAAESGLCLALDGASPDLPRVRREPAHHHQSLISQSPAVLKRLEQQAMIMLCPAARWSDGRYAHTVHSDGPLPGEAARGERSLFVRTHQP
jgi:short subunit dehydrogenase-like uncharacterized protein